MDAVQYLILANTCIAVLLGFYLIFLKKETFFQINRAYLLSTLLLSFIIPAIHSPWAQQLSVTRQLQYSFIAKPVTIFSTPSSNETHFSFIQVIGYLYALGVIVFACHLLIRLWTIKNIIRNNDDLPSFSFFKKIYLGGNDPDNVLIREHEHIHASQWHSVDVLLMELVVIINWFNPAVYLFRKELKNVHEFIADEGALRISTSKKEYAMLLFSQTFETPINNLVNPFFNQKLLKQRIMMIQKNKSHKSALLKYLLSAPIFILMLVLSSATIDHTAKSSTPEQPESIIVPQQKDDKVFMAVEHVPSYPGGVNKFYQFLQQNIKYPAEARNKKVEGKVFVSFIVEKDGSLSNLKVLRDPGAGCGAEALRVMKLSPKWNPGIQNKHKVRVQYTMPINFTLKA